MPQTNRKSDSPISPADMLLTIINELEELLGIVDGPDGGFIQILDRAETKLTKDGANVIGAYLNRNSNNPAKHSLIAMFHKFSRYIELEVGDGTTSATRLACGVLKRLLEKNDKRSFRMVMNDFHTFKEHVKTNALEHTLNVEDAELESFLGYLYAQTYTSSHGNRELSETVKEWLGYFTARRDGLWKNLVAVPGKATDDEFKIEYLTDGFTLYEYHVGSPTMYNAGDSDIVAANDANVIFTNVVTPEMLDELKDEIASDVPLYFVCSHPNKTITVLSEAGNSGGTFSPMAGVPDNLSPYSAIHAYMLSNDMGNEANQNYYLFRNIKVYHTEGTLCLEGVIQYDGSGVIKGYAKDSPIEAFLTALRGFNIPSTTGGIVQRHLSMLQTTFMFNWPPMLVLGGSEDVVARNMDILDDIVKAVLLANEHGIVSGGLIPLRTIVGRFEEDKSFAGMFLYTLQNITCDKHMIGLVDVLTDKVVNPFTYENLLNEENPLIVQPASIHTAILEGFEKYLLRLAFLERSLV